MPKSGFKLIAITVLEGCNSRFAKILDPNRPYYLCNNYSIERDSDGTERIIVSHDLVPRIYDINDININISAIVGKNGSGKSSLIELLYVVLYNISKQQRLLPKKDEDGNFYQQENNIRAAIYYSKDDTIYKLEQIDWDSTLYQFNTSNNGYLTSSRIEGKKHMEMLFYTIVVNYSHYALNTREIGHWAKALFHKNDGYQTPIVLNPFREEGNININIENYLVRSRLLANILEDSATSLWFDKNVKIPTRLHFSLDYRKFKVNKKTHAIILPRTNGSKRYVLPSVYKVFFGNENFKPDTSKLNTYAIEYILNKLFMIVVKYKNYHKFMHFAVQKNNERLINYLHALYEDQSHITFKLKQALNFLRFSALPKDKEVFSLSKSDLSKEISAIRRDYDVPTIELIPPSFLMVDIEFATSEDRFDKLSSGEKQRIYSFSSIIYHLKNLESILRNSTIKNSPYEKLIRYKNIGIIFDEIELYYHPDLQRRFINDLIINLRAANLRLFDSLNLIFVTHSPFILSDIPKQHTLYLDVIDKKSIQRNPIGNTFGGNIHDLLANSFFLNEYGYIGEYAKTLISEAYEYLKNVINFQGLTDVNYELNGWSKSKVRLLIDMIGEPLIQGSLNELYTDAFLRRRSDIDEEISRLQNLRNLKPE